MSGRSDCHAKLGTRKATGTGGSESLLGRPGGALRDRAPVHERPGERAWPAGRAGGCLQPRHASTSTTPRPLIAARPQRRLACSLPLLEKDNAAPWASSLSLSLTAWRRSRSRARGRPGAGPHLVPVPPEEVARAFGSMHSAVRTRPASPSPRLVATKPTRPGWAGVS